MACESITDFLLAHRFACLQDSVGYYFYRLRMRIPTAELAGHTGESFAKPYGLDQEPKWPSVRIAAVYRHGEAIQD